MSAVQDVMKTASVPDVDFKALSAEKKELLHHQSLLLPVEAHLRRHIEDRLAEVNKEAASYLGATDQQPEPLPIVDLSVLEWRHDRNKFGIQVPKLALVNIIGSTMTIPFPYGDQTPALIRDKYIDVIVRCSAKHRGATHFTQGITNAHITFTYEGAIPSESRELIRRSAPNFEQIYLMVDTPNEAWEYLYTNARRLPRPRLELDPLIVGWRYGHLYLLGQFDPTPIEKYAELEFTSRPALNAGGQQ